MHPLEVIKEVKTEIKSTTPGVPPKVKIEKKKTTAYKANTCDLCTQLSVPSCVYACPHDAAKRVDPQRFFGDAMEAQADILKTSWTPERRYETHTTH
jgi:Fe-S-cluster-containing hydrogenase component 2